MKVGLCLPLLSQAADDTSTLLSLKVQTTLETGVDHLLDAVGSRNVTQMSSLLQNLVEETISEEGPVLDADVKEALAMIKDTLLGDIRGALKEAHCIDQTELHKQILCFEKCEVARDTGAASCEQQFPYCDGKTHTIDGVKIEGHKECRDNLLGKYKEHIIACRDLDVFTKNFELDSCPKHDKKCCLLEHTTWNCALCESRVQGFDVDAGFGNWLYDQTVKFRNAYTAWTALHKKCSDEYHAYVEMDAKCDCLQAECETNNCAYENCNLLNCEDRYNKCWGSCEAEWERTNKVKECLEKDRKIDWSATEKIECYVDVLLASPTKEELLDACGTDDCISKYREDRYHFCNAICPDVDFTASEWGEHDRRESVTRWDQVSQNGEITVHSESDQDVTGEGKRAVRTRHRGDNEQRCTAHLDLDYQVPPCCHPCEARPKLPCTPEYIHHFYGQYNYLSADEIVDDAKSWQMVVAQEKCFKDDEHKYSYGYNLCDCQDCDTFPVDDAPVCTQAKECVDPASYGPARYNYRQHDIEVNCADAWQYGYSQLSKRPSIKFSTGRISDWTKFEETVNATVTHSNLKETGRFTPETYRGWTGFEEAVDEAVTNKTTIYCSKDLDTLEEYSNQKICGGKHDDETTKHLKHHIAYKIEVKFWVETRSTYTFDFNVDFGEGGVVTFDGDRSPEDFHSGDHWWNGKLHEALPLDITHDFDPGMHTMVVYGAEKCCDGLSNVRFKKGDSDFEYVTLNALTYIKADDHQTYAAVFDAPEE